MTSPFPPEGSLVSRDVFHRRFPVSSMQLGAGGFGTVHRSVDAHAGNAQVAVKAAKEAGDDANQVQFEAKVIREVRAFGKRLDKLSRKRRDALLESVPEVLWFGKLSAGDGGADTDVMVQDLRGPNLSEVARSLPGGRMSLELAFSVCAKVLQTLELIHCAGFIHRDIKARNVVVGRRPKRGAPTAPAVAVVDFGLAKRVPGKGNCMRGRRSCIGTPKYMSVSAHAGFDQGPRDDVQALLFSTACLARGGRVFPQKWGGKKQRMLAEVKSCVELPALFLDDMGSGTAAVPGGGKEVPEGLLSEVRAALGAIDRALGACGFRDRPPYEEIAFQLHRCIEILRGTSPERERKAWQMAIGDKPQPPPPPSPPRRREVAEAGARRR